MLRRSHPSDMDYDEIETLRREHPAWRLLASNNAALVLSFLQRVFIDANASNLPGAVLVNELDDELYALRQRMGDDVFPRRPHAYLDEWADAKHGWLRKFYPPGGDEPHYDLTPAVEKALTWVADLETRTFIGTESRLNTIFELLRQMVYGANSDPTERLTDLYRRRQQLDAQIERAELGQVDVLDPVAQRERYQQFARTARELMADFRQVEDNFRQLDRRLREQIAGWAGSKGDLLDDVLSNRSGIAESDQGRSFRAFYDLLLSADRQAELTDLLDRLHAIETIDDLDPRLARVHFDWIDASERTQATVRQLSEQLRRFLDDQAYLENRRVFDVLRNIESNALRLRDMAEPAVAMAVDDTRVPIVLPLERPLYRRTRTTPLEQQSIERGETDIDASVLLDQTFVDRDALAERVFRALGARQQVGLHDVIAASPLDHGLAELVTYFGLRAPGVDVVFDDDARAEVRWRADPDPVDHDDETADPEERVADIPRVTFARHRTEQT